MTSLKVAVRVRPLCERETHVNSRVVVDVHGKDIVVTDLKVPVHHGYDHRARIHRFSFDYCFWSVDPLSARCASQTTVYEDLGRVVLEALLQGYNSCIVAYGQSGSGKTYTMMGTKAEIGLTPRICQGLFTKLTDLNDHQLSFQVDISFMEIYNEQVYDLLQRCEVGSSNNNNNNNNKKKPRLKIREHPVHGPFVEGLSTHLVRNIDTVCGLIARGNENRVNAATHVHDRSSRSHAIFTIRCSQACLNESQPREVVSKLHLVDLAGSERAGPEFCHSRIKEGANINKSLVTLGNVISALVELSQRCRNGSTTSRQPYVPYRDSNLTWLLKDSLGGNSHTFMIAAVSPSNECYSETLSTLRYAQRAKNVLNRPVVNEDPATKIIHDLRVEVMKLKSLLASAELVSKRVLISPVPDILKLNTILRESEERANLLTKSWFEKWIETYNVVLTCPGCSETVSDQLNIAINAPSKELLEKENSLQDNKLKKQNDDESREENGTISVWDRGNQDENLKHDLERNFELTQATKGQTCSKDLNLLNLNDTHPVDVKEELDCVIPLTIHESEEIVNVDVESTASSECCILPNEIILYSRKKLHRPLHIDSCCVLSLEDLHIPSVIQKHSVWDECDVRNDSCVLHSDDDAKEKYPNRTYMNHKECSSVTDIPPITNYLSFSTPNLQYPYHSYEWLRRCRSVPYNLHRPSCRNELNDLRSMKEIGRSVTVSELAYTKERSIDRSNSESSHSRSQISTQEDITLTKSQLSSEISDCKGLFTSEITENSISDDETQSINDDGFCDIDRHTDNVQNLQYDATECSKMCPEIAFSDKVTEESFNLVDFLNELEQEDMEGMKQTSYSSQVRRDSEMWSLLSFSSSDCPFRDSADNFLSGSEEAAEPVAYSNSNESGLKFENNNRSMQDSFPSSWASDDSDDSSEELEFEYVDFRNKVCKNSPELIAIKDDYSSNVNKCFSKFAQDIITTRPRLECTLEVPDSIPPAINDDERMKSFPCKGKFNKLSPVFEEENLSASKTVVNNSMEVMGNIRTITTSAEFNRNLEEKVSEKGNSAPNSETVDNPKEIPAQELINRETSKTTIELNEQGIYSRNRSNVELNQNERLESKENEIKNSVGDTKDEILTPDQEISLKEEIHRNDINEIEKDIEKLINDIDLTDSDELAAVLLGEKPGNAEGTGISNNFEARMEMLLTAIDGEKSDTLKNMSKFSTNDLFQTDKEIEDLIKSAHIETCLTNSGKHLYQKLKTSDERDYDLTRNTGSRSLKSTQQNLERICEEEGSLENMVADNLSHHKMNSLEATLVKSNRREEMPTSLINIHFAKENMLDEFEMEGTLNDEKVTENPDTVEIRHSSDFRCPDNTSEQKLETSVQHFRNAEKDDNCLSKTEMQEISALEKSETSDDCSTDFCDFEGEFSEKESEECISIPSVSISYDSFVSPNHVSLPPIPEEEKDDEEEDVALVGESQNNSFMMDSLENPDVSLWENRYLQDNRILQSSNDATKQLLKCHPYPYPCLDDEEKVSSSEALVKGEFYPNDNFNTKEKLDGETKSLINDHFYARHCYNTEGKSDNSEAKPLLNNHSYAHHCYKEEANSETKPLFNGLSYALHSNTEKEKERLNAEMLAADAGSNLTDYDNADDEEKIDRLLRSLNIKFRDFGHLNSLEQKSGSWDSSKSSSSSDSITYVFVGKDHDEKTNNTNIDTNSSSLYSSLLSSVSLDSLEKSSFPPQVSCPSPRTLSIDSLIAEEMLFQLRNAESQTSPQNCANHQESVLQQNKPESFRLVQLRPYDGAGERTESKLINNKSDLDLTDCSNVANENYYSKDLSQTYAIKENNEEKKANTPNNNNCIWTASSSPEEFSEEIMSHLDGETACFPMANESCDENFHDNNNETETSVSQEEPTTKSYPFSEIVTEMEISLDSEFDDEQGSVLLPPPSSFDNSRYSQDITSTSDALESSEEEERAKNKTNIMISKSTQTDSFPESQRHASTETVESSRQTELVMSMMQLMLETVKLLKVERKQHVCASPYFVQSVDESQVKSVKRRLDFHDDVIYQTSSSTDSASKTFSDSSSLSKHCEMNSRAYDGNDRSHIRDSFNARKFHTVPRHGRISALTEDVLQTNTGCNVTNENHMYDAETTCLNSALKDESHSFTLPREYRKNCPRHQDQISQLSITKSPRTDFQNHMFSFPLPPEREHLVQNHIGAYGDNISETPNVSETLKKMRTHNLSPSFSPSLERKISSELSSSFSPPLGRKRTSDLSQNFSSPLERKRTSDLSPSLSPPLERKRTSDLSPSLSPPLERKRTSDLSPSLSPPLERKRTSDLSPSLSPPLGRKRTSDLSLSFSPPLGGKKTSDLLPSLSPSLGRGRISDLSPLPLGREKSDLSPSFSLSSERKRIADFSPSLSPTSSLDHKIPSPPTSTSSRSSSWSKKSSLKEHLNRLIEVRRRVVEATKSPKSYKTPNFVDGSKIQESLEKTKEYLCNNLAVESMFEKGLMDTDSKISPSSSSEGYLSSVSSRGVRRQFSEESTDSHGSNSLMNGLKALEEKDAQCLMTSLDLRGLHQRDDVSPSSRWHHTSTDSGAFFMDSPATCKKDDLPVETGNGSSGQAYRMGVRRKETTSSVSKPHTSSRKHEANHVTASNGILTSYKPETMKNGSPSFSKPGTSCKDTSHYRRKILAGDNSPGFRDLDEIGDIYKVIQRKTESKYGTSSSNENSRSSSLSPYMDQNSVKSSAESISDTNWQLTRSDAYRRLAAFEIDKSRLRMKDYVAEGSYSATSSLRSQSSLISDEDLFSYDSYMSLPSPRLYLSPSPASPYCPIT